MSAPAIVLDTQVVLDCFLFDEPSARGVAAALAAGRIDWIATREMRVELAAVLERGLAARRGTEPAHVLAAFDAQARLLPGPPPAPREARWACSDADDQKFVDLARAAGARWLLSRDRAVLKLARHARTAGLQIEPPARWVLERP